MQDKYNSPRRIPQPPELGRLQITKEGLTVLDANNEPMLDIALNQEQRRMLGYELLHS